MGIPGEVFQRCITWVGILGGILEGMGIPERGGYPRWGGGYPTYSMIHVMYLSPEQNDRYL